METPMHIYPRFLLFNICSQYDLFAQNVGNCSNSKTFSLHTQKVTIFISGNI